MRFTTICTTILAVLVPAYVNAQADAERFRAALEARQLLMPADEELGSARAIAVLSRQYLAGGVTDLGKCSPGEVRDTPPRAAAGSVNTYAVKLRGDRPCGSGPEANTCNALRNNCLTLGTTVFCDYDYLQRLRNLARSTYFYAHMGASSDLSLVLPSSPDLLKDFGTTQLALHQPGAGEQTAMTLSASERGAAQYASKEQSLMLEVMEFLVNGHVIGHEIGHVLGNACGSLAPRPEVADLASTAEAYYSLTCDEKLNRQELDADLLGIQNAARFMEVQWMLHQVGSSDEKESTDPRLKKMWAQKTTLGTLALLKALEYQLIVGDDAASGLASLRTEPDIDDLTALYRHYNALGLQRARRDVEARAQVTGARHMLSSYRAATLLNLAGMEELAESNPGDVLHAALRVAAYVSGHVSGVQQYQCGRSVRDAEASASEFIKRNLGLK